MKRILCTLMALLLIVSLAVCGASEGHQNSAESEQVTVETSPDKPSAQNTEEISTPVSLEHLPDIVSGQTAEAVCKFTDGNGDMAVSPAAFQVSDKAQKPL